MELFLSHVSDNPLFNVVPISLSFSFEMAEQILSGQDIRGVFLIIGECSILGGFVHMNISYPKCLSENNNIEHMNISVTFCLKRKRFYTKRSFVPQHSFHFGYITQYVLVLPNDEIC